jgi:hypothetical protein
MRSLKHLISDANRQIRTYQNKFTELRVAYSARAMLDVEISVLRILDDVDDLGEFMWWPCYMASF